MTAPGYSDIKARLEQYPCIFHIRFAGVTFRKLNELEEKLYKDLEELVPHEEKVQLLNMLTWIECKLAGASCDASSIQDILEQCSKTTNVCALANQAYVLWLSGALNAASQVVDMLDKLQTTKDYKNLRRNAMGHQGFVSRRFGGPRNLHQAITLYEEAVQTKHLACRHLFRYQLAVVYRRAAAGTILPYMPGQYVQEELYAKAAALLQEVAAEADDVTLRGRALAELTNRVFNCGNFRDILVQALECADQSNDVFLLTTLGRVLPRHHPERINVLEKAVSVRENSTAYHHLALSFEGSLGKERHLGARRRLRQNIVDNYEKSIQCVDGINNMPARFSYAHFLELNGDREAALRQYHVIRNMSTTVDSYDRMFVSRACLRAVQCVERMSRKENHIVDTDSLLKQSISIASEVASNMPSLMEESDLIWAGFKNSCELFCPDKNETNRFRQDDADFFKMLIRSVRVQRLGVMKDIFSKTSRTLDSEQFIRVQLEAYLKVRNFKDGMVFLTVMKTRRADNTQSTAEVNVKKEETKVEEPSLHDEHYRLVESMSVDDDITEAKQNQKPGELVKMCQQPAAGNASFEVKSMWDNEPLRTLCVKMKLGAAKHNLAISNSSYARFIYRSLFSSIKRSDHKEADVLVVHDNGLDPACIKTMQVAKRLQAVMFEQFELDVSRNAQSCQEYGPFLDSMKSEMEGYSVVLVLLGKETHTSDFEALLSHAASNFKATEVARTLCVATTDSSVSIPESLKGFNHICIDSIKTLTHYKERGASSDALSDASSDASKSFATRDMTSQDVRYDAINSKGQPGKDQGGSKQTIEELIALFDFLFLSFYYLKS